MILDKKWTVAAYRCPSCGQTVKSLVAAFTVGGVTKGVDGLWSLGATPMLTRFDVVSDAKGEISGTFAAADGNGGAFNGLTLVGDIRKHSVLMVIVR